MPLAPSGVPVDSLWHVEHDTELLTAVAVPYFGSTVSQANILTGQEISHIEINDLMPAKEYKDNKGSAISCLYSIAGRLGGGQAAAVPLHSGYVTCALA
jgi:hypothetical protein